MSHESRFRENDPARDLPPLGHEHKNDLAIGAIAAEPKVIHLHRKRSPLYVAAAAAAVVAIALPVMQPWQGSPQPAMLALSGASAEGMRATSADAQLTGKVTSGDGNYGFGPAIYGGSFSEFTTSLTLGTETSSATAYQLVTRASAKEIVKSFAAYLGEPEPVFDGNTLVTKNSGDSENWDVSDQPRLQAWIDTGAWSTLWYYDYLVDPWYDFVCEGDNDRGEYGCEPDPAQNLLTKAEAKAKGLAMLEGAGLPTTGYDVDYFGDDYFSGVTFVQLTAGEAAPIQHSFNFGENGKLYSAIISLDRLVALDSYTVISEQAAVERLNDLNYKWFSQALTNWKNQPTPTDIPVEPSEPGEPSTTTKPSTDVTSSGETTEPEPSRSEIDPGLSPEPVPVYPKPTMTKMVITDIQLSHQIATLADGTIAWLPSYSFYGHEEGATNSNAWPIATVIAVDESQIDLADYYNYFGGVTPLGGVYYGAKD